ncbi:IS66 family transposase, partial [Lacticaseibacillus mingshuiensis]
MSDTTVALDEHAEVIALRNKVSELEEQLAWFKKQIFGQKSEHTQQAEIASNEQLSLFEEQRAQAQAALEAAESITHVKAHDRKKTKKTSEKISLDVECVEKIIDITAEQRKCAAGWKLVKIGKREARTTVEYVPAKLNLDYSPRYLGHEIASGRSESNVWSVA